MVPMQPKWTQSEKALFFQAEYKSRDYKVRAAKITVVLLPCILSSIKADLTSSCCAKSFFAFFFFFPLLQKEEALLM